MPNKLTLHIFISRSTKEHNNKYDYSKFIYINQITPGIIICPIHGEFLQIAKTHMKGVGCPKCAINNRIKKRSGNNKLFFKKIKEKRTDKGEYYDYSLVKYINNYTKIKIICPIHNVFKQIPAAHYNDQGCPKCGIIKCVKNITGNLENFIKKSINSHETKYDYSLFVYINNNTKGKIICHKHGIFLQTPGNHMSGQGCPKCKYEKLSFDQVKPRETFIIQANIEHNNKYDYSKFVYINAYTKGIIICPFHGEFLQDPHHHINSGNGCSKCGNIISKAEIKFLDYLKIDQDNRQKRISKYKVDGYDPKTNTIYEFLGDFWHGNPELFDPNEINHKTHCSYQHLYDKTFIRMNKLKNMGYDVKYIWENDWEKYLNKIDNEPKLLNFL